MSLFSPTGQLPDILIPRDDFDMLMKLADAGAGDGGPADDLLSELERATVAEAGSVPPNVVRMGSTVSYAIDGEPPRTVRLVYPADADISAGAVSVLTPVGAALLGLTPGQSIGWTARDGTSRQLKVIAVFSGGAEPPAPPPTRRFAPTPAPDDPGPSAA